MALQEASLLDYRAKTAAGQGLTFAAGYGWRPSRRRLDYMLSRGWKNGRFSPSICFPINTPPQVVNQNLFFPVPE